MATATPVKATVPAQAAKPKRERKAPVTVDFNAITVSTEEELPPTEHTGDGFMAHLTPIVKRALAEGGVLSITVPTVAKDRTESAIRQIAAKLNKGARIRPVKLNDHQTKVYFKVTDKRAKKPNGNK